MIIYLLLINAAGLVLMCLDKLLAKKRVRRIPESTLLLVAALGGSLGATIGMYLVRHKTRHKNFRYSLPLMLVVHVVLLIFFC